MNLECFFNYKQKFMENVLTNEKIVSLINENIELSEAKSLIYKQVFPFEYIPETVESGDTFICCDVDIDRKTDRLSNNMIYSPTIFVWVFTHKSKLVLPCGEGVRTDKLCSEISKVLNGSMEYGLGKLELSWVKRFSPIPDFQGKVMLFSAKEISTVYDPHKRVPKNRREECGL